MADVPLSELFRKLVYIRRPLDWVDNHCVYDRSNGISVYGFFKVYMGSTFLAVFNLPPVVGGLGGLFTLPVHNCFGGFGFCLLC